jgi:signal transduction histidine kinase
MAAPSPRCPSRLRSTLDKVLVHDIKNISFRLRLLLSNLDDHWEDPEFRTTVRELLASTVERLEDMVGRFAAHEDAVLIKVALDVNGLLRGLADKPARRGRPARSAKRKLALGAVPRIWGDPFYLGDAFASLLENAFEAAGPEAPCSCAAMREAPRARARARRDHRQRGRDDGGVPAGPALQGLRDDEAGGVGLGLATASQIVRFHRGTLRILSHRRRNGRPALVSGGGASERPGGPGLGRIVIVDDDPFLVEQLTWALKGRFVVTRRGTRRRAARSAARRPISISSTCACPRPTRSGRLDLLRHARRLDPRRRS